MNGKQKLVLAVGLALILATGIFPPWLQSWRFPTGGEDVWHRIDAGAEGYSWIFQPPGMPAWVDTSFRKPGDGEAEGDMKKVLEAVRTPGTWRARIDLSRLLVEWAMVGVGVLVGILGFAQARDTRRV